MPATETEAEFQELRTEITDEDPVVRGIAAIDFGTFALDHPEYEDRVITLLERALNDPDSDVRTSAQHSLDQIAGKTTIVEPGRKIIGFGYMPDEYQRPEVDQKQMILSCVCCIVLIVAMILMFVFLF